MLAFTIPLADRGIEMDQPDFRTLLKAQDKAVAAAGAQRTEKQLAQLSLAERAVFVREQITALNRIMDEARRKGAPYAINVGRALLVTKAELRHGEFGAWIERDCKLALSTAKLYMLLARRAPELKNKGINLNEMSVRAMRDMVSPPRPRLLEHHRHRPGVDTEQRRAGNEVHRCILLLNHLFDHGNPDVVESELLPELLRVADELKQRRTRRMAVRQPPINQPD